MQSEVSQKEKDRYPILTHINKYIYIYVCVCTWEKWHWETYLQGRNIDADIENRLVREGEGGTNWKINIETYTPPYVKQIASGKFLNI